MSLDDFIQREAVELPLANIAEVGGCPLCAATRWVNQNITYMRDSRLYGTIEYWATPKETMDRRAGDCEDMSFVLASILDSLGYNVNVVAGFARGEKHVWVEARPPSQEKWFLLDATSKGGLATTTWPPYYRGMRVIWTNEGA